MPGEESAVLTDGGTLPGSSTAVFQCKTLFETSRVLLGRTDGPDLLIGMTPCSEEWQPRLRRVPPFSGRLFGRSLLKLLAKELDRRRTLDSVEAKTSVLVEGTGTGTG